MSTLIFSPVSTNSGTCTTTPVASVAGFIAPVRVSPLTAGCVSVTSSTIESLGIFGGPAIGGLLLAATSTEVVFGACAAGFLLSALLVSRVRVAEQPEPREAPESGFYNPDGLLDPVTFAVGPVRDDAPFFAYFLKPERFREVYRLMGTPRRDEAGMQVINRVPETEA